MFYVVEKSRDGSRRIYHKGKRIAYQDRRLQDGYKTLAAARKVTEKLSTDIALDIYSHRALEGERYYEENYKEYEIENTRERPLQMNVREFFKLLYHALVQGSHIRGYRGHLRGEKLKTYLLRYARYARGRA